MDVGLLCGSRGERSANAAILQVAAARLERAGHAAHRIEFIESMPPFDPALVDDPPAEVARFQRDVRSCDVLLVAAPEYAAGVAGTTKNALDWLVGDATIYRMSVGVASAGTTGGSHAVEQLVRTISWQGGWVVATLGVAAPRTKSDEHGNYTDGATLTEIAEWVDAVVGAAEGTGADRLSLLSAVVSRYGIDPARFGDVE